MISLVELAERLSKEKKVAIFCHVRPDGDTIGSSLALKLAMQSLGAEADVFCSDPVPTRFSFLKETQTILDRLSGEYGAYIAIDCADITRLGDFGEAFSSFQNTYSIDHHVSNNRFAKINYVIDNASNCENVYDLIIQMNVNVTAEIANLLATGVVTDTGNFKHNNLTPKTFGVSQKLLECGANFNQVVYNTMTKQTKRRAKLFGIVMSKIRYFLEDKLAIISIMSSDVQAVGALPDETEGFIDFIMGIDTVEVGVSIMQITENKYKISFRSKTADVNAVAATFGGGGHTCASGCQLFGDYEEVVDRICFAVSREIPDIL